MKTFHNLGNVMNAWWIEYNAFVAEVAKVKKLTKVEVHKLCNIRVKYD